MSNYIVIKGQKIELTAEQAEQIKAGLQEKNIRLGEEAAGNVVKIGSHEIGNGFFIKINRCFACCNRSDKLFDAHSPKRVRSPSLFRVFHRPAPRTDRQVS